MTELGDAVVTIAGDDVAAAELLALNGAVALRPPARNGRRQGGGRGLRTRVQALHQAAESELSRRRDIAALEPADSVPVPINELSSISRELPRLARAMPQLTADIGHALADGGLDTALRGTARLVAEQRRLAARRRSGEDTVDTFGFDREWTETLLPFFRFLYRHYWRVQVEGLEHVPSEGGALLVCNHAGVLPYDGAMVRMAIFDDHPARRHGRALILNAFFGVPVASWFLRRTGNTLAHPDDARRLLEDGELVLVFPEGAKGTGKPYRERYRLRRFGRGGFVSVALAAGAPLIPVSIVGSEEVHPMVANVTPVAQALGMPYFPMTPTFPLLGPLGLVPLPSSWRIRFHPPIPTSGVDAGAADDAALVMRLSDQVRDTIQGGLYELLEERGSVFA